MAQTKTIVGYTDRLSVVAGDRHRFMISADPPCEFDARLVRLVCGDSSAKGAGFQEEAVQWSAAGRYKGARQPIYPGSYGIVRGLPSLTQGTLTMYFMPTLLKTAGIQTIGDLAGCLTISLRGDALTISTGKKIIFGQVPVVKDRWHWIVFSFHARQMSAKLICYPYNVGERLTEWSAHQALDEELILPSGTLTLGASLAEGHPHQCLNGKLERPWLADARLDPSEALSLSEQVDLIAADPRTVGVWDFSMDISSDRFIDRSQHGRHGKFCNTPTRAIRGIQWDGSEQDWKRSHYHYGAVHFHQDDLTDAEWTPTIESHVPFDLPSGIYAVKLTNGQSEEYIPFFVRPHTNHHRKKVVFLASTATYLAYANNKFAIYLSELFEEKRLSENDRYLREHPEAGLSLYDRHVDGSGVHYSSYLRPVLDLKPKSVVWSFTADTNISAWLHWTGIPFDVVTDEDLDREGSDVLVGYAVVISGTHPEYCSTNMLRGLEGYLAAGGRLMYMGGNGFYWRIAYHPVNRAIVELRRAEGRGLAWDSQPGEYYHSFNGEYGGLWRRIGRPPNRLVGIGFNGLGCDGATGYRRQPDAQNPRVTFIFANTSDHPVFGICGSVCGGAVSQEIDRWNASLGSPSHALVVASSDNCPSDFQLVREDSDAQYPDLQGPKLRADMVFFETPNGGAVFSTGSIGYAGALSFNQYENDACRIVTNVLKRFIDMSPFQYPETAPRGLLAPCDTNCQSGTRDCGSAST